MSEDFSFLLYQQDYHSACLRQDAATELLHQAQRRNTPSAIYQPRLFQDGNAWCAVLGDDLAIGVTGWGHTPADAMAAFDRAWHIKATCAPTK